MIKIYPQQQISVWAGFGGAITEATAYNYSLLSEPRKQAFLKAYYHDCAYTWGRISIGSNDFCLAPYEYTDNPTLEDFSIEHERRYSLPLLKDIFEIQNINLVASPWSPPSFMKNNRSLTHGGKLKKKYYETYAKYLRLFVDAYYNMGYAIDFLTIQNEPAASQRWESCTWTLKEQHDFIYNYLLRRLDGSGTAVLVWDHNRENLSQVADALLSDKVAGIAFHIYGGTCADQLRRTRQNHQRSVLINTESCCAFKGDWQGAAEYYLADVFACLNSGVNAYLDWNMLLDQEGGPTWANNPVKSPIMLNDSHTDFVRTPIYNYLRIVSNAFPPGTRIVTTVSDDPDLLVAAGLYQGDLRTVLMNVANSSKKFQLDIDGFIIQGIMPPHTILQR